MLETEATTKTFTESHDTHGPFCALGILGCRDRTHSQENRDRLWDKIRKKRKGSDERPRDKNLNNTRPQSWGQMDSPRAPSLKVSFTVHLVK